MFASMKANIFQVAFSPPLYFPAISFSLLYKQPDV